MQVKGSIVLLLLTMTFTNMMVMINKVVTTSMAVAAVIKICNRKAATVAKAITIITMETRNHNDSS